MALKKRKIKGKHFNTIKFKNGEKKKKNKFNENRLELLKLKNSGIKNE